VQLGDTEMEINVAQCGKVTQEELCFFLIEFYSKETRQATAKKIV